MGAAEIAEFLGVTRQHAHRLMNRDDFPQPVARLTVGRIYRRSDIERWAKKPRPPGRPEKPYPPKR